jgi:TMEM199 family protein
MSRLRREAESRAYNQMLDSPRHEALTSHFPSASAAHAFSATAAYAPSAEEEEIMYSDVNRQVTLIFNVLVSVFACAAAIWIAARWWDTPVRLVLSMSGSILVGVAEVVVYSGYLRRVGEAKAKEGKVREVKEVVRSWVVGGGEEDDRDEDEDRKGKEKEGMDDHGGGGETRLVADRVRGEDGGVRERKRRKEDT